MAAGLPQGRPLGGAGCPSRVSRQSVRPLVGRAQCKPVTVRTAEAPPPSWRRCRKARPSALSTACGGWKPGRDAERRVVSGRLQSGNGKQSKPRHGAPRGAGARCGPRGRVERRGRRRQPQGCRKPGHRDTISGGKPPDPSDGRRASRSRAQARESPRSKRWCQRRCDRDVRTRDSERPLRRCALPREGAETSLRRPQGSRTLATSLSSDTGSRRSSRPPGRNTQARVQYCKVPHQTDPASAGPRLIPRRPPEGGAIARDCLPWQPPRVPSGALEGLLPPGCEVSLPVERHAPPEARRVLSGGPRLGRDAWSNRDDRGPVL